MWRPAIDQELRNDIVPECGTPCSCIPQSRLVGVLVMPLIFRPRPRSGTATSIQTVNDVQAGSSSVHSRMLGIGGCLARAHLTVFSTTMTVSEVVETRDVELIKGKVPSRTFSFSFFVRVRLSSSCSPIQLVEQFSFDSYPGSCRRTHTYPLL